LAEVFGVAELATLNDLEDLSGALSSLGLEGFPLVGTPSDWNQWVGRDAVVAVRGARGEGLVLQVRDATVHWWSGQVGALVGWIGMDQVEDRVGPDVRAWIVRRRPFGWGAATPEGHAPLKVGERLHRLLSKERGTLFRVALFAAGIGGLNLATPLAIQWLIQWLAAGTLLQPLVVVSLVLLACLAGIVVLQLAQRWAVELLQRRLFMDVVTQLHDRFLGARRDADAMLAHRFFDVATLQKTLSGWLLDGFAVGLQAAVGMILLAIYHPALLAIAIGVIVLTAAWVAPWWPRALRAALSESSAKYSVASWLQHELQMPLPARQRARTLVGRGLAQRLSAYLDARDDHFTYYLRQVVGVEALQAFLSVGFLVVCAQLVMDGQLTLGQLVAAEFIFASTLGGITKLVAKLESAYDLLAGVSKIGGALDTPQVATGAGVPRGASHLLLLKGVQVRGLRDGASVQFTAQPGERWLVQGDDAAQLQALSTHVVGRAPARRGSVSWLDQPVDVWSVGALARTVEEVIPGSEVPGALDQSLSHGDERSLPGLWSDLRALGIAEWVLAQPGGLSTASRPEPGSWEALALAMIHAAHSPVKAVVLSRGLELASPGQLERALHWIASLEGEQMWWVIAPRSAQVSEGWRRATLHTGGLHVH